MTPFLRCRRVIRFGVAAMQQSIGYTMPIKFYGLINLDGASETKSSTAAHGPIDFDHMVAAAKRHEANGFERVLLAQNAKSPDPLLLATYLAERTDRLKFMVAQRAGFVTPTWAARSFATLNAMFPGRFGIHVISGGDDADQRADGDFLGHGARYSRSDEWLEVFRKEWSSATPFDHHGAYYRFEQARSDLRPDPQPPIFFGGSSDAAIAAGAGHADIWALFGEPLAETAEIVGRIRAAAVARGRAPDAIKFMMSLRPIVGATEEAAWQKAHLTLEAIKDRSAGKSMAGGEGRGNKPQSHGSERLRRLGGGVHDARLWTELSQLTGGRANTTGLVGTAEQIAESLVDYTKIGVDTFLIRGFDPLNDADHYGKNLIPIVRAYVAGLSG